MTSKKNISAALSASFLAATCIASPAQALEPKQCGSKAEIIAALRSEGQVEIVSGIRAAIGGPRNIFTSNADGTLGYNIEAGAYEESGNLCVGLKYTDIFLNGNPGYARPAWASMGPNSDNDRWLDHIEQINNDKVIMGATSLMRGSDGVERKGAFMLVTRGNPADIKGDTSVGSLYVRSIEGLNTVFKMGNVEPNANFAQLAKRPVQTAALALRSPN